MADIEKPYTFTDGEDSSAVEVNADFDTLYTWVNEAAVHADGTAPFTALPSAPSGTVPTADGHLMTLGQLNARIGQFAIMGTIASIPSDADALNTGQVQITNWSTLGTPRGFSLVAGVPTFSRGGVWVITASAGFASATAGQRRFEVLIGGGLVVGKSFTPTSNSAGLGNTDSVSKPFDFGATTNKTFQGYLNQNSGAALSGELFVSGYQLL